MTIHVRLTDIEVVMGTDVGEARNRFSAHRPHKANFKGDGAKIHVLGALGEMAVAKASSLYWSPKAVPGGLDSEEGDFYGIEVRTTEYGTGRLIVKRNDPENRVYLLVTGKAPNFTVVGYCSGDEAKNDQFWDSGQRSPAFFVPQSSLRPINTALDIRDAIRLSNSVRGRTTVGIS